MSSSASSDPLHTHTRLCRRRWRHSVTHVHICIPFPNTARARWRHNGRKWRCSISNDESTSVFENRTNLNFVIRRWRHRRVSSTNNYVRICSISTDRSVSVAGNIKHPSLWRQQVRVLLKMEYKRKIRVRIFPSVRHSRQKSSIAFSRPDTTESRSIQQFDFP